MYIALLPTRFLNKVVMDGECAKYVEAAIPRMPTTKNWRPGVLVKGAHGLPPGVAIATFQNGLYANKAGVSHAAIYLGQDKQGIWVLDQWTYTMHGIKKYQPVHKRQIMFHATSFPVNNGLNYYVIEHGKE
jgi:hypothetical protein